MTQNAGDYYPMRFGSDFSKLFRDFNDCYNFFDRTLLDTKSKAYHRSTLSCVSDSVYEDNDKGIIELIVPGYSKEEINIDVSNEALTISAETQENNENKKKAGFVKVGFTRAYTLNKKYDAETIEAQFKDGILTISMKQKTNEKLKASKKIEIK